MCVCCVFISHLKTNLNKTQKGKSRASLEVFSKNTFRVCFKDDLFRTNHALLNPTYKNRHCDVGRMTWIKTLHAIVLVSKDVKERRELLQLIIFHVGAGNYLSYNNLQHKMKNTSGSCEDTLVLKKCAVTLVCYDAKDFVSNIQHD